MASWDVLGRLGCILVRLGASRRRLESVLRASGARRSKQPGTKWRYSILDAIVTDLCPILHPHIVPRALKGHEILLESILSTFMIY